MKYHFVKLTRNEQKSELFGIVFDEKNLLLIHGQCFYLNDFMSRFGSTYALQNVAKHELMKAKLDKLTKQIEELQNTKLNLPIISDLKLINI